MLMADPKSFLRYMAYKADPFLDRPSDKHCNILYVNLILNIQMAGSKETRALNKRNTKLDDVNYKLRHILLRMIRTHGKVP